MNAVPTEKSLIGTSELLFAQAHRETLHTHAEYGQLKWPSRGVSSVRTPEGIFVTAPTYAVWIPPDRLHGGIYSTEVLEKSLFVHASCCGSLPRRCCLTLVSHRLADTIVRTVASHAGYAARSRDADEAVLRLVIDEVADMGRQPLALTLPDASSLQTMLDEMLRFPADQSTLADWSRRLRTTDRTLRRTFARETGLSFSEWRKRTRILYALQRLCTGEDVNAVAAGLRYESPSAFVYMFRRTLGITPGRYYPRPSATGAGPEVP